MKLHKTYKIQIQTKEQDKLKQLQKMWYKLIKTTVGSTIKLNVTKQLDIQQKLYKPFRKTTKEKWNLHSQHLCSAFKVASEMVRSCLNLCKTNCRTRFPTVPKDIPIILTQNTVSFHKVVDDFYANIAFQPHKPVTVKLEYPKHIDYYQELNLALQRKAFRIRRVKLLIRNNQWYLYITVEKDIFLPNWDNCKTKIGVDLGINYLVAVTAVTKHNIYPTVYVKGKLWKHLQRQKRTKTRKTQSRGANTKKVYKYYNERFKEILNDTANKVISYAKQFDKPLIVMENLKNLRTKRRKFSRYINFILSNWQRKQLYDLIEYKAHWNKIPLRWVSAYKTSKICNVCGNEGQRKGTLFYCPKCDKKMNSDGNASINIALRAFSHDEQYDRKRIMGFISPIKVGSPTPETTFCLTGDVKCN